MCLCGLGKDPFCTDALSVLAHAVRTSISGWGKDQCTARDGRAVLFVAADRATTGTMVYESLRCQWKEQSEDYANTGIRDPI